MGKSVLDKEKQEKKSKVVTMQQKAGGEIVAAGEGGKPAATKKPKRAAKSAAEKKTEKKTEKGEKVKQAGKGAKKALRRAVKVEVKARSEGIAHSLVENVERGDVQSATLMISLMEKKKKKEGDTEWDGPSAAELLASEPEWDEEMEKKQAIANRVQGTRGTAAA
jgi:hypothetical protein